MNSRMEGASVVPDRYCVLGPLESDLQVVVVGQEIIQVLHQETVS
jgi:hypothetical protein